MFRYLFFVIVTAVVSTGFAESVWIEGEAASRKKVTRHGWYDSVKKDALSGGAWISNYHKTKEGSVEFDFDIAEGGSYAFWIRANPLRVSMAYSIDGGVEKPIDMNECRGRINIASNNKPDMRFIAWKKVGEVELKKAKHTLKVRFFSKLLNHGAIDCLVFTNTDFVPSGTMKPGKEVAAVSGPETWFPVVFDDDKFSPKSVIDISSLVEAPAGMHGYLIRKGKDLVFEKQDKPVKFWGCGGNLNSSHTREQMIQRARYLRKHGVNMIRQHTVIGAVGLLKGGKFDSARMDKFDMWFAELKKQGIYMTWSITYPHHGPFVQKEDGYDLFHELKKDRNGIGNVGGLINIFGGLQDIQLKYAKALLLHKNPYTGLRYADDPALAVLEIQNEDCVFFHVPLNDLRDKKKFPEHSKRFRRMFGTWLKKKYKTEAALKAAWGGLRGADSWAVSEFETMGAYHFGADGPLYEFKGQKKRAGDFVEFLAELQRSFYERREKEYRDLGFKGVTVTTAWKSGGPAADPANLYCDTACDMIDRHNYFGGGAGRHSITEGKVNNGSIINRPGTGLLASGLYQVEDRPFAMTEWSHLPPNQWKFEAAPLMAFYGFGLQGWDASYHFLNTRVRQGDGWPNLSSYVTDTPHYIGQFPAIAFALYKGHIKEAPIAVARRVTKSDLFQGIDALKQDLTGGINYDVKTLKAGSATPAEALAIGRVTVSFDGGRYQSVDLSKFWDRQKKIVRSMTGELTWDYGRGLVTLHGPKTQAVIGRAGSSPVHLPGVSVTLSTPFVSLIFTPLDDKPLVESGSILITAMARDKQKGARYSADGSRIESLGSPPLLMEPVQAKLKFKGSAVKEVRVLDVYGVPNGKTVQAEADGAFVINGQYRTYYYQATR